MAMAIPMSPLSFLLSPQTTAWRRTTCVDLHEEAMGRVVAGVAAKAS